MRNDLIWFELAGQHSDNLSDFYSEVLGWCPDARRQPPSPRDGSRPERRARLYRRRAHAATTSRRGLRAPDGLFDVDLPHGRLGTHR